MVLLLPVILLALNIAAIDHSTLAHGGTSDLAYYNPDRKTREVEEITYQVYVGSSSRQEDLLAASFQISGP